MLLSCTSNLRRLGFCMGKLGSSDKWEFYKDTSGRWRWRRIASNGRIVGASTEGYANKADCEANARRNGY
ncbi:YegP family protein [Halomonas sp. H5]|uniref:YegP family protein n=1 Tax=Halomonas sp. H5 TaxID=3423910 RepID=UPI003D35EC4F